jgi:hypothetical protein
MNWFDRIVLLLTGLTAVYLIWQFYGRYQQKKALHDIYYMFGFLVLFLSGVLLIIGGWGLLKSPYVLTVATLIPLNITMGLMNQFLPKYKKIYSWFAVLGFLAIAISSIGGFDLFRRISVPVFHGTSGMIIFLLPLYRCYKKQAPKGFGMVGIGGMLIGIGGIALAFVVSGKQLLFFSEAVILMILAPLLLLMALAYAVGFTADIKHGDEYLTE